MALERTWQPHRAEQLGKVTISFWLEVPCSAWTKTEFLCFSSRGLGRQDKMSQIKSLCQSPLGCFWDFWIFWQASSLSSGPGKQLLYFVVQPAFFPQVASDLIIVRTSINLWPGQDTTAACQWDVCTSYMALCLTIWTFYTGIGTSRLYPVNWKVLGKPSCCLSCSLNFTARAKT